MQDLKGSIRVFCRVRPAGTTGDAAPSCINLGTDGELAVYDKTGERKVFRWEHPRGGLAPSVSMAGRLFWKTLTLNDQSSLHPERMRGFTRICRPTKTGLNIQVALLMASSAFSQ